MEPDLITVHHSTCSEIAVDRISPDSPRNILCRVQSEQIVSTCKNEFKEQVTLLEGNDQIRELQTNLRDKDTTRGDFTFCADRLIRIVVEEALALLPYEEVVVTTPTGHCYEGKKFVKGLICGVSIMRSGEAMEQGLRDCCRSIRIGKILIQTDPDTDEAKVFYAKFPSDIIKRQVLLLYPIMSSGNTVIKAIEVLKQHGVYSENVLLVTLFCTPYGLKMVTDEYPMLRILTSEIHPISPNHFGQKYFGTE